jgi:hypothetical protein
MRYKNENLFPEVSESNYKQGTRFMLDHTDIPAHEGTAEHLKHSENSANLWMAKTGNNMPI